MATISPVIGAPNSFTAIDEAFVTTEIVEPETNNKEQMQMQKPTYISTAIPEDTVFEKVTVTEPNASGMPIKRTIEIPKQMDKENDTMEAFIVGSGVDDYTTEKEKFVELPHPVDTHAISSKEHQVYSPGYFQRALDAMRGRRNSESYSAHTSLRKDNLENTNWGESSHSKSLGTVSTKEIYSTQGSFNLDANLAKHHGIGHPGTRRASSGSIDAPYNIYGSTHPSVVGRKGSDRGDSIIGDLDRGYHNALDSLKHVIGWDKHNPAGAQNAAQYQPRGVVDSAADNFNQLQASKNPSDRDEQPQQPQQAHTSPLSSLTDHEFPLLI